MQGLQLVGGLQLVLFRDRLCPLLRFRGQERGFGGFFYLVTKLPTKSILFKIQDQNYKIKNL
jgi:hypothetical protein